MNVYRLCKDHLTKTVAHVVAYSILLFIEIHKLHVCASGQVTWRTMRDVTTNGSKKYYKIVAEESY